MLGFRLDDLPLLRCPTCHAGLEWDGRTRDDIVQNGVLQCASGHIWRVKDGIPNLADRTRFSRKDMLWDVVFDLFAPLHDLSVDYLLPVLQYPDDGQREDYIRAMKLKRSDMQTGSFPKRVLEVASGPGGNLPLIRRKGRRTEALDVWAVDLNRTMVEECADTHRDERGSVLRLAEADAHDLPFADSVFDRVLHVGGINIYRDARRALAEMARVSKPGTPIVVVDEGLDKSRDNNLLHKAAFCWLTSLDEFSEAPVHLIPSDCKSVGVSYPSRFYYCMVYQKV